MTGGREALGFSFSIQADDARIEHYLDDIFSGLTAVDDPVHRYQIAETGSDEAFEAVALTFDDDLVTHAKTAEVLLMNLVHDVNQRAVSACPDLAMHAGGVAANGVALAFPAIMEAGKTTLTAGLVRAGFEYLTDEAVIIDRSTLEAKPYPKPLSLDPGSWDLFPELEPQYEMGREEYKAFQWQVPPKHFRADAVGDACPIGFVIFPQYRAGSETRLQPLGRAEAVMEAAQNTFRFNERSRESLDVLAEVIRGAECYRLPMGDLSEAVARVTELAGATTPGPA